MAIGERIHFFRTMRGMTQKYLGMLLGFPEKSADVRLAQYETGSRTPTKTCWIAHMKEVCGISVKNATNRISPDKREKPCPPEKMKYIKDAFTHFGMI